MASHLQKLLKKTAAPPFRVLSSLNNSHLPQLSEPSLSPFLHPIPLPNPNPNPDPKFPLPFLHHSLQIYPTFPHFHHSDPIYLSLLNVSDPESEPVGGDGGSDDTVWADSVKKKRKRKMNKHKYRKLRKRLRRQT